ncbi:hypothetical protein KW798_03060 [Candidatus Parcubacteria bacterium]|nr:hypothetical protein [Candidatus Parcubacteria bacterium]
MDKQIRALVQEITRLCTEVIVELCEGDDEKSCEALINKLKILDEKSCEALINKLKILMDTEGQAHVFWQKYSEERYGTNPLSTKPVKKIYFLTRFELRNRGRSAIYALTHSTPTDKLSFCTDLQRACSSFLHYQEEQAKETGTPVK